VVVRVLSAAVLVVRVAPVAVAVLGLAAVPMVRVRSAVDVEEGRGDLRSV
jgi:hypothetical protein